MKLLSWNIQWGRGMDGRVDLARILRTIRELGDFDVPCLQEVAVNFPGLPGYTAIYGPATDMPDGRDHRSQFGNAIFSRLPVGQAWWHLLPWPGEADVPSMQRMLVESGVATLCPPPLPAPTMSPRPQPVLHEKKGRCLRRRRVQRGGQA